MSKGYTFRSLLQLHLEGAQEIEAASIQRVGPHYVREIVVLFREGTVLSAVDMNHEPPAYALPRWAAAKWAESFVQTVRQDNRVLPMPPRPLPVGGELGEWAGAFATASAERAS